MAIANAPTKEALEQDIKVSSRWLEALDYCTFHGRSATDIATLQGFLKNQNEMAKAELEKRIKADAEAAAKVAK